jgi:adenylosuccinate synthase
MKPRFIVLSGKVGAGKSTLAKSLSEKIGATLIRSKDVIYEQLPKTAKGRRPSQLAGQRLDKETDGRWLAEALNQRLVNSNGTEYFVVDSVRTAQQVHYIRRSGWTVIHVHLEASDATLESRYAARSSEGEFGSYADVARNMTERHVDSLASSADVVIDTDRCSILDVFSRVFSRIETRPVISPPNVDVLIGGQYGSEGKGNVAHYLAPEYDVLVRVGGPNAGHKVFRPGLDPFTFRQLPSGALGNPKAKLVIGAGAVIGLDILLEEVAKLAITETQLLIDPQAMIIDEADVEWEEGTLKGAIGSTAQGIGAATARKILYRRVDTTVRLAKDIPALKHYLGDTIEFFAQCVSEGKRIMLEGTQGTSLSLHHGHYPHVTSRVTSAAACLAEAGLSTRHVRRTMMVCRTYPIRVGDSVEGKTSGYMSQVLTFPEIARRSGIDYEELRSTEIGSVSGRQRRIAEFDWSQFRRSLLLNGPTDIALTFADYFSIKNREAFRYEQLTNETLRFIEEMEKVSGVPVSVISTAFRERNIIDRRMW